MAGGRTTEGRREEEEEGGAKGRGRMEREGWGVSARVRVKRR